MFSADTILVRCRACRLNFLARRPQPGAASPEDPLKPTHCPVCHAQVVEDEAEPPPGG
jgi:hypothetical protein